MLHTIGNDGDDLRGSGVGSQFTERGMVSCRVGDQDVGLRERGATPFAGQPEGLAQRVRHHALEAGHPENAFDQMQAPDRLARDTDRPAAGATHQIGCVRVEGIQIHHCEGRVEALGGRVQVRLLAHPFTLRRFPLKCE